MQQVGSDRHVPHRGHALSGADGIPALVERFQAAGARITLHIDGDLARVPATSGARLYRIPPGSAHERRQARPWHPVEVHVTARAGRAALCVDSAGPPTGGRGMGLIAMRERAQAVGGSCEASPGGTGWRVRATVPTSHSTA